MSVQSDTEMLFIEAQESYAARHQLPASEVNRIFHTHQIYEKILTQHEYLHQISFEEVMEFVEESIQETSNELRLFHGTVYDFRNIDLDKSHNRRDFGRGFYTTILPDQAREWAYRLSLRKKVSHYYVYQYLFTEPDHLKILRFDTLNREWLEFVRQNRSQGGLTHDYDVVIGPVADDNTMETVQLYISGILTAEEAIERLRYNKVNNQVSFHTMESLQYLRYVGRKCYE